MELIVLLAVLQTVKLLVQQNMLTGLLNAYLLLPNGLEYGNNTESQFFGSTISCNSKLVDNQSAGGLICVQHIQASCCKRF